MNSTAHKYSQLLLVDDRQPSARVIRGGVELESDALMAAAGAAGLTADRVSTAEVSEAIRGHAGSSLVFTQRQGHLNPTYKRIATGWLSDGARVVEKNVFALASPHRPDHSNYFMLVMSYDGLCRVSHRTRLSRGSFPTRTLICPNPSLHPTSTVHVDRDPAAPYTLLRVGRPSTVKWSTFELDFAIALAIRQPNRLFQLVCIGAPEEISSRANRLPSNLHVDYRPYGQNLTQAYRLADAYIHHSKIGETFGNTVAEARAFGLPVVLGVDLRWDAAHVEHVQNDPRSSYGTPRKLLENATAVFHRLTTASAGHSFEGLTPAAFLARLLNSEDHIVKRPSRGAALRHMQDLRRGSEFTAGSYPLGSWLVEAARAFRDRSAVDDV